MSRLRPPTFALALGLALATLGGAAEAACYADFRAKRDTPYGLTYGVIEIPDAACSQGAAAGEIARRIARDGWTLLDVRSIFGPEGLESRRASAGANFLRY